MNGVCHGDSGGDSGGGLMVTYDQGATIASPRSSSVSFDLSETSVVSY